MQRFMKKIILSIPVIVLTSFFVSAQVDSLQKQINEQVWKPFIKAFNNNDDMEFKRVHSPDVIRVMQDNNQILGFGDYFRKPPDSLKAKWGAWKRNIELRFIQRIAANGRAFEVGYYKTTSFNSSTGEKRTSYGKFHVLLRKENGTWKILMDADAGDNTNEAIFMTGKVMEGP
jgi:ketosteroid isomerase-like protein